MSAQPEDLHEFGDESQPANFDELQEWLDGFDPQPSLDLHFEPADPPPVQAALVDLAAGEFFCRTWRRRLDAAQGDFGHVARQMRKAGVPLDLALAILLTSEQASLALPQAMAPERELAAA
jgi:hypothetical protein